MNLQSWSRWSDAVRGLQQWPAGIGAVKRVGRSPALFGLGLACFVLPFVTVTCQGAPAQTFSGLQVITGADFVQPALLGAPQRVRLGGQPLALVAAVCAIAGVILSWRRAPLLALGATGAGVGGALAMLLLKAVIDQTARTQGRGLVAVHYDLGFYLVWVLLLAGAGSSGSAYWRDRAGVGSPQGR